MKKDGGPLGDRARVLTALRSARWIVSEAARALGVSREAVYRAMERHRIQRRVSKRALLEALRAAGARGGRPRKDAA